MKKEKKKKVGLGLGDLFPRGGVFWKGKEGKGGWDGMGGDGGGFGLLFFFAFFALVLAFPLNVPPSSFFKGGRGGKRFVSRLI